jgi:hypothetical protein
VFSCHIGGPANKASAPPSRPLPRSVASALMTAHICDRPPLPLRLSSPQGLVEMHVTCQELVHHILLGASIPLKPQRAKPGAVPPPCAMLCCRCCARPDRSAAAAYLQTPSGQWHGCEPARCLAPAGTMPCRCCRSCSPPPPPPSCEKCCCSALDSRGGPVQPSKVLRAGHGLGQQLRLRQGRGSRLPAACRSRQLARRRERRAGRGAGAHREADLRAAAGQSTSAPRPPRWRSC